MISKLLTHYLAWNAVGVAAGFGRERAELYITQACWFVNYWFGLLLDQELIHQLAKLEDTHVTTTNL